MPSECVCMMTFSLPVQEERAEQLRSFSFLSGIVAGFAIASFLQLDFHVTSNNPDNPDQPFDPTPQSWQLGFAISVGLTVCTHSLLVLVHALSIACYTQHIAVEITQAAAIALAVQAHA